MKRIAVLTSGGDAPGMNAAIRSVVRTGYKKGWEIFGVREGYTGLINEKYVSLGPRDVGGIIQKGGTFLGSSRCLEFKTEEGRLKGFRSLKEKRIDGLVVIGGNGSQVGNFLLYKMGFPVVGIASTIDNDLVGTDVTIGVDTALNIALEAIDRLSYRHITQTGFSCRSNGTKLWIFSPYGSNFRWCGSSCYTRSGN